jgi:uncharacterized protein (TIGR03086 family)
MQTDPDTRLSPATDYRAKAAAVQHLVSGASTQDWDASSACEQWSARDVLQHMVDTQRDFLSAHDLDPGHLPTGTEPERLWGEHTARVATLLDDPQSSDRAYDGHFGPTTVAATLSAFYGWDMLVHRWDIAVAMARDPQLSEADLDEIERDLAMFGDALYAPGICAPAVEVGAAATRTERVMARLGRDARAWTRA